MSFAKFSLAHALWIETKATGKVGQQHEVKVFYGEYVANERDSVSKWYSDVKEFSLWLTVPGKEKVKLDTKAGVNYYSATFNPNAEGIYFITVVHEAKELGGETKYEFSSLATVAVGKNSSINANPIQNSLYAYAANAQIYKLNNPVKITAVLSGKVLANKAVSVFSPSGWSRAFTTNSNGEFEFNPIWDGRYVIEVSNYEKVDGEHYGKSYNAAWQGSTYSFEVAK